MARETLSRCEISYVYGMCDEHVSLAGRDTSHTHMRSHPQVRRDMCDERPNVGL